MAYSRCILAILVAAGATAPAARAQCGEPPSDSSCAPRVIPGSPGVYEVVMGLDNAQTAYDPACGFNVGHMVWFSVTPTQSGLLTFSTCHPATSFDTVLQVWRATGDCEFPQRLDELCVDDTPVPACNNGCSFYGGTITIQATANTTYLFEVGAYNDNSAGCLLCLGVRVIICGGDATPPVAQITSPSDLGCACDVVNVVGTANDPDGALDQYTLEFRPAGSGTWTLIATGNTPVVNGSLAIWNTTGLSQGWYFLRLTVRNACGASASAVSLVMVDKQFDNLDFRSPAAGAVVGRQVCVDGTAWDQCFDRYMVEYRPIGGSYSPVDPGQPVYTSSVINDPLATWNSLAGVPDGDYELRVSGATVCGNVASSVHRVKVDNTAPVAVITDPINCASVDGMVQVRGTANDANLASWELYYTGGSANGWVLINSGASPVVNGVLGNWNAGALPACAYTLRLVVSDRAVLDCNGAIHNRAEYLVSVSVGGAPCPGDVDGDGDVDLSDLGIVLANFGIMCP